MRYFRLRYRRTTVWAGLALLGAACTVVSLQRYIGWLRAQIPAGGLVEVAVAARDIEAGQVIEAGMVRTAGLPARAVPRGALRSADAAVGNAAMTPLDEGQALTARTIGRGGPSALVPKGMRAFDLLADAGGLAPRQGDRVDVIATFPGDVTTPPTATTVLRWRAVAGFMAASDASATMGFGPALGDVEGSSPPGRITLLVTPEEAERLAMAETYGHLRVVLGPADPDAGSATGPRPSEG
jgi:pilus assembly protein CpaB